MRTRSCCPMGRHCSTVPALSMVVPCMALWKCSLRTGFCFLSRHRGVSSWERTCIISVLHSRRDLGLIFKQEEKMKKKILSSIWVMGVLALAVFCLSACDRELDIQRSYPFSLETMPVQNDIIKGQTAEIRCTLK